METLRRGREVRGGDSPGTRSAIEQADWNKGEQIVVCIALMCAQCAPVGYCALWWCFVCSCLSWAIDYITRRKTQQNKETGRGTVLHPGHL